jgi:signal transduction histidine kinase
VNASHAIAAKNKDGTERGRITISTRQFTQYVQICIEDTGVGIPENIRERVFDPFFTTKTVGMGTGQGLAIAHDVIVKKHSGTIGFTSEKGNGTVFTIHLPLEAV